MSKSSFASGEVPSEEEIATAIFKRNSNDPFLDAGDFGFSVTSISRDNLRVEITYSFYYDPSRKDEVQYSLFNYSEDWGPGFFPDCLPKVTLSEAFEWASESELYRFDLDACEAWDVGGVVDRREFYWDDPDFPSELFEWAITGQCVGDPEAVAQTLHADYSASGELPDFVPVRLRPYFLELLHNYKQR